METSCRFLHLEDDPLDAEYVETQLRDAGLDYEIRRVETREEFRRALEEHPPDLILCDYNLPGFDGLEALRIAQESPHQAPFIFLSGGIGEHLAVECLHRGATDYVLKGNPARLIPAIKRALEESRIKRAKDQVEKELADGEKMALLGQLSAGIAHEINNPITYINLNMETLKDYATTLRSSFQEGHELMERDPAGSGELLAHWKKLRTWYRAEQERMTSLIEDIDRLAQESLDGGQRISDITQRLRRFSRHERQEPVRVDLEDCMETALRIGWGEVKNKCVVHRNYASPAPHVLGHPNQITQVFLNLVVNAAQAIPVRGTLDLGIAKKESRAVVTVHDDGHGILPENLGKMFAPFFTTKPAGTGTGLGLYVSMGIVEAHGGSITAGNAPDGGAIFTVEFPLADAAGSPSGDQANRVQDP